jgi:hypothetical protein
MAAYLGPSDYNGVNRNIRRAGHFRDGGSVQMKYAEALRQLPTSRLDCKAAQRQQVVDGSPFTTDDIMFW